LWADCGQHEIPCLLRGRLRKERLSVTSLVVVGDRVTVESQPDGTGTVASIHPRRSELSRPGPADHNPRLKHVIAANIDQVLIVQAARQPNFKRHLVDRFLVIARRGNMEPLLVVNKCDLEDEALIRSWVAPLVESGLPVILTSAEDSRGVDRLREVITGRISVLAGQSGVGKSSLLNAMFHLHIRTNAVSATREKGRHTTTSSRLYRLPGGGYLADTPGIRTLALFEEDEEAVEEVFPEILEAAEGCKFRDCSHSHEPHCAVKRAVDRGEIDRQRYESYVRLLRKSGR